MHLEEVITRCLSLNLDHLAVAHFPMDLDSIVKSAYEKAVTRYVFNRVHKNQVHTAQVLGINRNTCRKRLFKYNIIPKEVPCLTTPESLPSSIKIPNSHFSGSKFTTSSKT